MIYSGIFSPERSHCLFDEKRLPIKKKTQILVSRFHMDSPVCGDCAVMSHVKSIIVMNQDGFTVRKQ